MILTLPPQTPVTLDVRATSLGVALPRVGEAFGVAMRAAPAIADEIAVLSLKGVTLSDFQARLAAAFAAEWDIASDGTLTLNRSARLRGAEERAYFERRKTGALELIASLRKEAADAPPITPALVERYRKNPPPTDSHDFPRPQGERAPITPERRLLAGLVAGLRPEDLTAVNGRVVYSLDPTPMQRPFPVAVAPLIAQFERERALVNSLQAEGNDGDRPASLTSAPLHTLFLVVQTVPGAVGVELGGYDATGRLVAEESEERTFFSNEPAQEAERSVAVVAGASPISPGPRSVSPPTTDDPKAYVFPISAESRAFTAALGNGLIFGPLKEADRRLAAPFLDVVARDPLSYTLSDIALEAGRLTDRSVIVRAHDEEIFAGFVTERDQPAPIRAGLYVKEIDLSTPGWLVARPDSPYLASLGFFPRPALRKALELAYADGAMRIATASGIAALTPDTGIDAPLAALPQRLAIGRTYLYLPALRMLAEMGEDGRRRAERGVRFDALPSGVQQRLERLIFGPGAIGIRLSEERPGYANLAVAIGPDSEPTWTLPNGIPRDARLTVTTTGADGVVPIDRTLVNGRVFGMDQLASYDYQLRHPKPFSPDARRRAERWRATSLRRAGRETTNVRLDLDARHCFFYSYVAYDAPSGPEFTMATLPPDLKAAFDQAMAGVEARFRDAPAYGEDAPGEVTPP